MDPENDHTMGPDRFGQWQVTWKGSMRIWKGCSTIRAAALRTITMRSVFVLSAICVASLQVSVVRAEQANQQSHSMNSGAIITDEASFYKYPWPDPGMGDYSIYEYIDDRLPGNMKALACSYGGVLENAIKYV